MAVKYCPRCKDYKDTCFFGKNKSTKDGMQSYCSKCRKDKWHEDKIKNPQKHYIAGKKWRENNKEKKKEADKLWAQNNRKKSNEIKRRWKTNNPEKHALINQKYSHKHRDVLREKNRQWALKNPEKKNLKEARRRANKLKNGVFAVYPNEIKQMMQKPCFYCGHKAEHIDHIIPISRGGRHSIGNLIQACRRCNISKNDKFITEWRFKQ